jgi:formylglycine-generating enzyme required for sulfatase activity
MKYWFCVACFIGAVWFYFLAIMPSGKSVPTILVEWLCYDKQDHKDEDFINCLGMEMVGIRGGDFVMARYDSHDNLIMREVSIPEFFYISQCEVTQEQYKSVMGSNPSHFKGDQCPVESVSFYEAKEFCRKLSRKEGANYTLPTEEQWEYVCRAGIVTEICPGYVMDCAWYSFNSNGRTHSVGQKEENAWGIYDMHGNVSEMCILSSHNGSGKDCAVRGGNWSSGKSVSESFSWPVDADADQLGFRVVKLVLEKESDQGRNYLKFQPPTGAN